METHADFARRHVVPQGRTLTVNITGFQAIGFTDGKAVDVTVDPSDFERGSLIIRLVDAPSAGAVRFAEIVHETKYNLPPGSAKHQEPQVPVPMSDTYPYVRAFSRIMEFKLQANRHKGDRKGWVEDRPIDLLERVKQELSELLVAVFEGSSQEDVALEAADIANMAMMVADAYIHQQSLGQASIIDLQPEERATAPVHGGIGVYGKELGKIADSLEDDHHKPLFIAHRIRVLAADLVAYVEGL